jgi:hypothetical protein
MTSETIPTIKMMSVSICSQCFLLPFCKILLSTHLHPRPPRARSAVTAQWLSLAGNIQGTNTRSWMLRFFLEEETRTFITTFCNVAICWFLIQRMQSNLEKVSDCQDTFSTRRKHRMSGTKDTVESLQTWDLSGKNTLPFTHGQDQPLAESPRTSSSVFQCPSHCPQSLVLMGHPFHLINSTVPHEVPTTYLPERLLV